MDRSSMTKEIATPAMVTTSKMNDVPSRKMEKGRDNDIADPTLPSISGAVQQHAGGPAKGSGAFQQNGSGGPAKASGALQSH